MLHSCHMGKKVEMGNIPMFMNCECFTSLRHLYDYSYYLFCVILYRDLVIVGGAVIYCHTF